MVLYLFIFPTSFRVTSLPLGQSCDCPNGCEITRWCHQTETFLMWLALCEGNPLVTSGFPSQRPVAQSIDVSFDLHLNKQFSRQSRCWWFETPSCSLWCHCNEPWRIRMLMQPCRMWVNVSNQSKIMWIITTTKQSTTNHMHMQWDIPLNLWYKSHLSTIVDHSDVVGASPVGAAPTTSSFSI